MKRILKKAFNTFGLDIVRLDRSGSGTQTDPQLNYEYNAEALESIRIIRPYTMVPYVNLVTLFELVKYCEENHIEGDYVECGVWKGGCVGLMALANLKYGRSTKRNLHLFDAFDDICEPDPVVDGKKAVEDIYFYTKRKESLSGKLQPVKGFYDPLGGHGTVEGNRQLLEEIIGYPVENTFYHVGWFQDTLPGAKEKIQKIALLRLDGDWYESTKVCIQSLYDKVVPGGVIIVDDYGTYEGCKKAITEFIQEKELKVFLSYSNTDCRYWIK
ncbi:MAG: TylF/MycF/NovP-related O-methyltransferase [Spirosomataceae bacterium]